MVRFLVTMTGPEILAKLHLTNPFTGFKYNDYPDDMQGWNHENGVFDTLIGEYKPKLIVEVGTWKGASAIAMAKLCGKHVDGDFAVVCVDTWLGSLEFLDITDGLRYGGLNSRHGYPQVYYTFLANVCRNNLTHRIVPFPQTSTIAARWFEKNGVIPDMVYVDGSHETKDALDDMIVYWELLPDGGVLLVDDMVWPSVADAVHMFEAHAGKPHGQVSEKVYWVKNGSRGE